MKIEIESLCQDNEVRKIAKQIIDNQRISSEQAIILLEKAPLGLLGMLATRRKKQLTGDLVFYNKNIHIEPTNVCIFRCKFCSYRRGSIQELGAWYYTLEEIEQIAIRYKNSSITEVHIVGGVHPHHTLKDYIEMIKAVKKILPNVAIKAYTAVELHYIIKQERGIDLKEGLRMLQEAGMEAIPGGGAEIFDPEIRERICGDKSTAQEWLATHEAAHELGITTNATILYGHAESYIHRIDHLDQLRQLQDLTGGFSAFIPLKYRSANNSMSDHGEVSLPEDMRMLAVSRLFLDNFDHIKAYWPMLGKDATELSLHFGADDIDGTIDDTTKIYSMAGAEDDKPAMSSEQMRELISRAGYRAVERDTFYNIVE